jgi:hypothetical protein
VRKRKGRDRDKGLVGYGRFVKRGVEVEKGRVDII